MMLRKQRKKGHVTYYNFVNLVLATVIHVSEINGRRNKFKPKKEYNEHNMAAVPSKSNVAGFHPRLYQHFFFNIISIFS